MPFIMFDVKNNQILTITAERFSLETKNPCLKFGEWGGIGEKGEAKNFPKGFYFNTSYNQNSGNYCQWYSKDGVIEKFNIHCYGSGGELSRVLALLVTKQYNYTVAAWKKIVAEKAAAQLLIDLTNKVKSLEYDLQQERTNNFYLRNEVAELRGENEDNDDYDNN